MDNLLRRGLFVSILIISLFASSTLAQTCKNYNFSSNKLYSACNDLPYLSSFLYYNYDTSTKVVEIAYRHTGITSSSWVAWAINPTGSGMVGSQAFVAYQQSDGSTKVYKSPVTSYQTTLAEGELSFPVSDYSATYSNGEMTIFATFEIPGNSTTLNQVWQDGPLSANSPQSHNQYGPNIQSMGTVNLLSGQTTTTGGGNSRLRKKHIHGVLNAVSWGIMMPIGALIARYLKVFKSADPAWFYLHVGCQSSAYIIGVAGWATGLKLGSESPGITYTTHRTIGIILFCLGTLQVFALLLRPRPDHKYRMYWNIYHHLVGYLVIILSVINIFKGLDILKPDDKWKNAYRGVIIALAANAIWLEAYTWWIVIKRRRSDNHEKVPQDRNEVNGANVYGARDSV